MSLTEEQSMRTRKKYSKEFKLDAVSLVLEQGYSKADAARSLEIDPSLIRRWAQGALSASFINIV